MEYSRQQKRHVIHRIGGLEKYFKKPCLCIRNHLLELGAAVVCTSHSFISIFPYYIVTTAGAVFPTRPKLRHNTFLTLIIGGISGINSSNQTNTSFYLGFGIDFSKKVNKKSIELCYNDIGSKPKVDTRTSMKYSVLLENTRKLEE